MTWHPRAFLVFHLFFLMFILFLLYCFGLGFSFFMEKFYSKLPLSLLQIKWQEGSTHKSNKADECFLFSMSIFLCIFYSVSVECGECLLTFGMTCQNHVVFSDFCLNAHASGWMWPVCFCLWEACFHSVESSRQVTRWLSEHWHFGLSLSLSLFPLSQYSLVWLSFALRCLPSIHLQSYG